MEKASAMLANQMHSYGPLPRESIERLSGKALLQAIVDGELPQGPISEYESFWLVAWRSKWRSRGFPVEIKSASSQLWDGVRFSKDASDATNRSGF
jgi:hypothetical protein